MNKSGLNEMLGSNLVIAAARPAVLCEEIPARDEDDVSPRSRRVLQWPEKKIRVLIASPEPEDHIVLPEILDRSEWLWSHSRNCRQAAKRLQGGRIRVIVCERDLPDGCWQDVLETCACLEKPPSFIVSSRLADELLWSKVLNLGGYDVLAKPFEREEVVRVVYAAWRFWGRAYAAPSGGPPFLRVRSSGAGFI